MLKNGKRSGLLVTAWDWDWEDALDRVDSGAFVEGGGHGTIAGGNIS
jgi:hypothetical protein